MTSPADYEALYASLEHFKQSTGTTDADVLNLARQVSQGIQVPSFAAEYRGPGLEALLRQMSSFGWLFRSRFAELMFLPPAHHASAPEMTLLSMTAFELISEGKLSLKEALTGHPAGGGLYPPSALRFEAGTPIDVEKLRERDDFYARERELLERFEGALDRSSLAARFQQCLLDFLRAPAAIDDEPWLADPEAGNLYSMRYLTRPTFSADELRLAMWRAGWHLDVVSSPNYAVVLGYVRSIGSSRAMGFRVPKAGDLSHIIAGGREAAEIARHMDVHSRDELERVARAERRSPAFSTHLERLALASTPRGLLALEKRGPEEGTLELLIDALRDEDVATRYAALLGCASVGWEELKPEIVRLANSDREPLKNRNVASRTLDMFESWRRSMANESWLVK